MIYLRDIFGIIMQSVWLIDVIVGWWVTEEGRLCDGGTFKQKNCFMLIALRDISMEWLRIAVLGLMTTKVDSWKMREFNLNRPLKPAKRLILIKIIINLDTIAFSALSWFPPSQEINVFIFIITCHLLWLSLLYIARK
jgi:hypothetical protein